MLLFENDDRLMVGWVEAQPGGVERELGLMWCDPEGCGNWPGQRQDPWKYIDVSSPIVTFKQVLRPESCSLALVIDRHASTHRSTYCEGVGSWRTTTTPTSPEQGRRLCRTH